MRPPTPESRLAAHCGICKAAPNFELAKFSAPVTPSPPSTVSPPQRFGLFCKTFAPDVERFQQLLESIERHAESGLQLTVSIPRGDATLFHDRFGTERFRTVFDEDITHKTHRRGWRTQQLVKLWAYRANFADAWLWVDSDSYFIRDFKVSDFVRDGKVAAIVSRKRHVLDDHEADVLRYLEDASSIPPPRLNEIGATAEPTSRPSRWSLRLTQWRDRLHSPPPDIALGRVAWFFGRESVPLEYLPCAVWTTESLTSFEQYLMSNYGWSFCDLINFAPWEAAWVGEWELSRGAPNRFFIEPPMLHIREDETILRARKMGLTAERIASRYHGIVLAARHQTIATL
jgi:hypothetical protein